MQTRPSGQSGDTLPQIPAVADPEGSDFAEIEKNARRRSAVRRTGEAFAEFAKEVPEMVIEIIEGLLP